jgi:hypothetical protein
MDYPQPPGFPPLPSQHQSDIPPPLPPMNFRPPSKMPWYLTAAVASVAAYGAYWGYGERARLTAKVDAAGSAARAAQAATESIEEKLAALQAEKDTLEADKEALATARDFLAKSVEEKSSELATLKGTDRRAEGEDEGRDRQGRHPADRKRRQTARRPGGQDPVRLGRGLDFQARGRRAWRVWVRCWQASRTGRFRFLATPTTRPFRTS